MSRRRIGPTRHRARRLTTKHTHQPGEAVFRSILPEDVDWKPFQAFPPSARLAVLIGELTQAGPYVIKGQGALGRETHAAQAPGGPGLYVMSGVF
jgi:hypothetical protein